MSNRLTLYIEAGKNRHNVALTERWGASSWGCLGVLSKISTAITLLNENGYGPKDPHWAELVAQTVVEIDFDETRSIFIAKNEECEAVEMNSCWVDDIDVSLDGIKPISCFDTILRSEAEVDEEEIGTLPDFAKELMPWSEISSLEEKLESLGYEYFADPEDPEMLYWLSGR